MINSIKKLKALLCISNIDVLNKINYDKFPMQVTNSYIARIEKGNNNDPLLLQILPSILENKKKRSFILDPLYESEFSPIPGLIHKCQGRVLLLVTNRCAIKCRFCFRRHESINPVVNWNKIFSYIKNNKTIYEVILSGGDPLILSQKKLKFILEQLWNIKQLSNIRIHTRIPIVMPELITQELVNLFTNKTVIVVHCNHPNEINNEVILAIKILLQKNIIILNQTVLLNGINDNFETLIALSKKLFNIGIIPYYLHMLDHVEGASHFYVSLKKAKALYEKMKQLLPGYLVPKLVKETKKGKEYV